MKKKIYRVDINIIFFNQTLGFFNYKLKCKKVNKKTS